MSIGIEVNIIFVRNHEIFWKPNDTCFVLGTVLQSWYNIPQVKFSLRNTNPGAVSKSVAESEFINLCSAFLL